MTIYKEEIFKPVVSVIRAKNYDEALQLVNDHPYGNGTSIYIDGEISRHFTTNAKIGMVGVNVPILYQWPFIVLEVGNSHYLEIIQFMEWKVFIFIQN